MSTPADLITLRAPALAAANSDRIPDLIVEAEALTGPVFGAHRPLAVALLVLHWLALEARGDAGAPGPINSEKEGDLARSYGSSGDDGEGDLGSTRWGLELKRLRNATIFAARNRLIP
ncbi:MAG TPA: DUF4054 domain-containing protein [Candidatus Polarisedimenticolia bacterium]|nr:DUF4054 domain-containing protein [Candidatus Polarisedimenticolia bacterium]